MQREFLFSAWFTEPRCSLKTHHYCCEPRLVPFSPMLEDHCRDSETILRLQAFETRCLNYGNEIARHRAFDVA